MNPSESDISQHDDDHEGYQLEVHEVAQLLGVTRTRVSQLTSNGQLSFERRRVGTRNRLFYKRSEVLSHQKGFYGRHVAHALASHGESQPISAHSRAGARASSLSEEFGTLNTEHAAFQEISENSLTQSKQPSLQKILNLLIQIQNSTSRTLVHPRTSASLQLEDDKNRALVFEIIENIEKLAIQLSQQTVLLNTLREESRSMRKELHGIQQNQRTAGTFVKAAVQLSTSASCENEDSRRRPTAPRHSRSVALKKRSSRF